MKCHLLRPRWFWSVTFLLSLVGRASPQWIWRDKAWGAASLPPPCGDLGYCRTPSATGKAGQVGSTPHLGYQGLNVMGSVKWGLKSESKLDANMRNPGHILRGRMGRHWSKWINWLIQMDLRARGQGWGLSAHRCGPDRPVKEIRTLRGLGGK